MHGIRLGLGFEKQEMVHPSSGVHFPLIQLVSQEIACGCVEFIYSLYTAPI